MLPLRTVLHATDFSERSDYAFRIACSLARDYGAKLVVMHVVQPPLVVYGNGVVTAPPQAKPAELKEKLRQMHAPDPKVQIEHVLSEGDPVAEILREASERKSDVVVIGTHGWTGWTRLLMGSVAEGVVRRATCPVLTIKMPDGMATKVGGKAAEKDKVSV